MDRSGWTDAGDEGRAAMLRRYRDQVRRESENNAYRWSRMNPAARARYPELSSKQ